MVTSKITDLPLGKIAAVAMLLLLVTAVIVRLQTPPPEVAGSATEYPFDSK